MYKRVLSLVGIKTKAEIESLIADFPDLSFELAYNMSDSFLKEVKNLLKGRVASLHALCPRRESFPNLASNDRAVIKKSEEELLLNAETLLSFGGDILVLHPGYLSDALIPTNNQERMRVLEGKEFKALVAINEGSICTKDYTKSKIYQEHYRILIDNLISINERLKGLGVRLAIENLNPRAGYLFIEAEEMLEAARSTDLTFTLDVGHLLVSSEYFGFDYMSTIEALLKTERVINVHLHSNPSSAKLGIYKDSHEDFDLYSMDYKGILSLLSKYRVNATIEALTNPQKNVGLLY